MSNIYVIYTDAYSGGLRTNLKAFPNSEKAIEYAIKTAYELSKHKYTIEYIRNKIIDRFDDGLFDILVTINLFCYFSYDDPSWIGDDQYIGIDRIPFVKG